MDRLVVHRGLGFVTMAGGRRLCFASPEPQTRVIVTFESRFLMGGLMLGSTVGGVWCVSVACAEVDNRPGGPV